MATYKLFFAATQHKRKCIKVTGATLTREDVVLMAQKLIKEDTTLPAKGKLRRFLHAECVVRQSVRLL